MIVEPQHGESWLRCVCRYASLVGVSSSAALGEMEAEMEDGYSEERAAWLVLERIGVL